MWNRRRHDGQDKAFQLTFKDLMRVGDGDVVPTEVVPQPLSVAQAAPLAYLAAVARGELNPSGLSSLRVNMVVSEILEAARESARTGKRVVLRSEE